MTQAESLTFLDKAVKRVARVNRSIPYHGSSEWRVFHNGGEPVQLREYLSSQNVEPQKIERLVQIIAAARTDRIGELNLYRQRNFSQQELAPDELNDVVRQFWSQKATAEQSAVSDINPYELSYEQLFLLIRRRLLPVYECVNPSLDGSLEDGFNRHGERHVRDVTKTAFELLYMRRRINHPNGLSPEEAAEEKRILLRTIIEGMGHDVGNLLSRGVHEALSPIILSALVPELLTDQEEWEKIVMGITYHNEPFIRLAFDANGLRDRDAEIAFLSELPPDVLALIVSDKVQIGRDRVTGKPVAKNSIESDRHLAVNLLFQHDQIQVSSDGSTIRWKVNFIPGISEMEPELDRFARGKRAEVHVSERTHRLHREHGIPHFYTATTDMFNLYFDRFVLMIEAAFALFPTAQIMQIRLLDPLVGTDSGSEIVETIPRIGINEAIHNLAIKYLFKDERQKWKQT